MYSSSLGELFSDAARTISDRGGDNDDNSRCRDDDDAINASVVVRIRSKSMPISNSNSTDKIEDVEHIIVTLWVFFFMACEHLRH